MRTIKFRAKSINLKDWIYGLPSYDFRYLFNEDNLDSYNNYEVIPETIGQFTGLKDKNGVEIYEGDKCKYYQPYANRWDEHIIKWDEKWAAIGLFEEGNEWCKESDFVKIKEIEVIGNIHDK